MGDLEFYQTHLRESHGYADIEEQLQGYEPLVVLGLKALHGDDHADWETKQELDHRHEPKLGDTVLMIGSGPYHGQKGVVKEIDRIHQLAVVDGLVYPGHGPLPGIHTEFDYLMAVKK